MSLQKRIQKEYRSILKTPLIGAGVEMREDDCTIWDCALKLEFPSGKHAPIHFVVQFPESYPIKAPMVGFSHAFKYTDGASHFIQNEGPLLGKFTVCLDILGNYDHVHTEWASEKGSGWSPAYTLITLLVNLQSVLFQTIVASTAAVNDELYLDCIKYASENTLPKIWDGNFSSNNTTTTNNNNNSNSLSNDIDNLSLSSNNDALSKADKVVKAQDATEALSLGLFSSIISTDIEIPERIKVYCEKHYNQLTAENKEGFINILQYFINGKMLTLNDIDDTRKADEDSEVINAKNTPEIDSSICCWYSGENYSEAILGYGINVETKKNGMVKLTTDGNLISYGAYSGGLRLYPTKEAFVEFLPAWINADHASNNKNWVDIIQQSVKRIGLQMKMRNYEDSIYAIYPDMINTLVVRMMEASSDFRASEKIFQCILNLWRVFYYLSNIIGVKFRKTFVDKIVNFINDESSRRKNVTPDIGCTLVISTILSNEEADWGQFLNAFVEESSLRRVFWWRKDNIPITPFDTYRTSEVSRNVTLFQTTFKRIVIGDELETMLAELDKSNCQMPFQLNNLLEEWKNIQKRAGHFASWNQFYEELWINGLPTLDKETINNDISGYINDAATKADNLVGYKFESLFRGSQGGNAGGRDGGYKKFDDRRHNYAEGNRYPQYRPNNRGEGPRRYAAYNNRGPDNDLGVGKQHHDQNY